LFINSLYRCSFDKFFKEKILSGGNNVFSGTFLERSESLPTYAITELYLEMRYRFVVSGCEEER
jgi:hypothetical protein